MPFTPDQAPDIYYFLKEQYDKSPTVVSDIQYKDGLAEKKHHDGFDLSHSGTCPNTGIDYVGCEWFFGYSNIIYFKHPGIKKDFKFQLSEAFNELVTASPKF